MPPPVSLQISIAPSDFHHAIHVVPHQLRTLADQVAEVVMVLDSRKSPAKRWRADWDELAPRTRSFLNANAETDGNLRVLEVDYGPRSVERVARRFFARSRIPAKDLRGGPFFSYFFALAAASHDHVFHLDCDMLLGGGSASWVSEAADLVVSRTEVMCVCPLPGPPAGDGLLRGQDAYDPVREGPFTFRFRDFTSRVFLCDRRRLAARGDPLPLFHEVPWWGRISGAMRGRSTFALPERLITAAMRRRNMIRVDLLGAAPGLWTLHPADHALLQRSLPEIIARVERGEVTEPQVGRYDLDPSMIPPRTIPA